MYPKSFNVGVVVKCKEFVISKIINRGKCKTNVYP